VAHITDSVIRVLYSTIRSLGFLTRLPLDSKWFESRNEISTDAHTFPFAGCIVGFIGGLILLVTTILGFSPLASTFLAVITLVAVTGALHEDGLSDVADAFWALKTPQERLALMKKPQIGVFGGLALVFTVGLRVILLADIMASDGIAAAFLVLMAVEAASRGAMVWFWKTLPPARNNGVAVTAGQPDRQTGILAAIAALFIFAVLMIPVRGFLPVIAAVSLVILCIYAFIRLCRNKIGGCTGDAIGAMQQVSTAALLADLAIRF